MGNEKKVELLARIVEVDTEECYAIGAVACDESSEKYIRTSSSVTTSRKRIIFTQILKEFNHDDIIRITIETVKVNKKRF